MKIMHILSSFSPGGAEIGVVKLIQAFPDVNINHSVCNFGLNVELERLLVKEENYFSLAIERANYIAFIELYKLFRNNDIDIAHVNNLAPWFDVALASRLAGCKCIQTFHGIEETTDRLSPARRMLLRLAASMTSGISAVGEVVADRLVQLVGLRRSDIRVIPNGVDTALYAPSRSPKDRAVLRKDAGLPIEGFIVVCVAALRPVKDHDGLLKAFAGVLEETKRKDVFLALVGDGELAHELRALSGRLGIDHQTLFMGRRNDVPAILQASDAFALNSLTEGMSYAILEAMASGLPVVATDVGGNRELICHGQDGFLIPRGECRTMGRGISMLVNDPSLAAELGRNGREKVLLKYSLKKMIVAYARMYKEVLLR